MALATPPHSPGDAIPSENWSNKPETVEINQSDGILLFVCELWLNLTVAQSPFPLARGGILSDGLLLHAREMVPNLVIPFVWVGSELY